MFQLGINAACAYVRRVLDELTSVEDIGMLVSPDALDLHKLVEGSIVEAAVKVHRNAPSVLVDGIQGVINEDFDAELTQDGVIVIKMLKDTTRVASIQVSDSPVVISELIPENSAEGRKQLNKYVRGVADDPRVVLAKRWRDTYQPVMLYYSTKADELPEINLEYIPYPMIEEGIVLIAPRLEYAILNEIAAMVLDSLDLHSKAEIYRNKSKESMEVK